MVGNTSGPCPRCGGMGHVPDGRYDTTHDTIRILATSARSIEALRRLESTLRGVNRPGVTGQAVADAIKTDAPEFSALAPVVQRGEGNVTNLILIILTAILALYAMWDRLDPSNKGVTPAQIREITREVLKETQAQGQPSMIRVPLVSPGQSRNSLCRCGSGKKFKRCHGR
jgi:SEC-C motif-containing protein